MYGLRRCNKPSVEGILSSRSGESGGEVFVEVGLVGVVAVLGVDNVDGVDTSDGVDRFTAVVAERGDERESGEFVME